jgi:hypothetical protein
VGSSARSVRMRGTLLWFNESDDVGALRTDDGERLDVPGTAFPPDEKPVGRCAGTVVEFESINGVVTNVAFVPDTNPRRARMRHRR